MKVVRWDNGFEAFRAIVPRRSGQLKARLISAFEPLTEPGMLWLDCNPSDALLTPEEAIEIADALRQLAERVKG